MHPPNWVKYMSDKFKKILGASITSICMMLSIMGCGNLEENVTETGEYKGWEDTDKDFSKYKTPGSQESNYVYSTYFLPSVDGIKQPYVGDPMPFYEDGIYYIYYLKDCLDFCVYLVPNDVYFA